MEFPNHLVFKVHTHNNAFEAKKKKIQLKNSAVSKFTRNIKIISVSIYYHQQSLQKENNLIYNSIRMK